MDYLGLSLCSQGVSAVLNLRSLLTKTPGASSGGTRSNKGRWGTQIQYD